MGGASPVLHSYSYDSAWKELLRNYNGKPINYDGTGNPTHYKSITQNMWWQNGRELKTVTNTPFGTVSMQYDYAGLRTISIAHQIMLLRIIVGKEISCCPSCLQATYCGIIMMRVAWFDSMLGTPTTISAKTS